MFWPKMSADISDYVQKCTICLERRNDNPKEPLKPYPIPTRPWQVVGSDLFTLNNENYLVTVDYYSRYMFVDSLHSTTSNMVITKLKKIFSLEGIANTIVTDNGPQYSSAEFAKFTKDWGITHITSSPHFPSSNGLAEKTVQTVTRLLDKAKSSNCDPY